jgi:hypothetical protein
MRLAAATLDENNKLVRLPVVADRLALSIHAIRHAIQRKQFHRVPPPDYVDPYRWKVRTLAAFEARPATRQASTRGYRPGARQGRMFDRIGKPLAIAK